ncbi:MAG: hypothetical protein ACK5H2_14055 [Beutenbergiaceae bacterium]
MNTALYYVSVYLFVALPAGVLAIRFLRPARMPWWAAMAIIMVGGWILANAVVYFRFEHLGDLLDAAGPNPPQDLMDAWASDGGSRIFTFILGGLYALIYSTPFLILYAVAAAIRARMRGPRSIPPAGRLPA